MQSLMEHKPAEASGGWLREHEHRPMPSAVQDASHWFAVFTASNNEKKVQQHLRMKDIETFLPLYSATRRWKNRTTVKVELPLFAGYVFARFARTQTFQVLDVPMVYSIVGNKAGAVPLPDDEIEALRLGLAPANAEPHPYLKVGQRARILAGSLAGLAGIVTRVDGGLRVVLSVESIMRSIAVRVTADNLEFLDQASSLADPHAKSVAFGSLEQA